MEAYLPGAEAPATVEAMIWISAIIRIVVCFLPQNNWCTDDGNMKLSILRNAVFAVTGIGVIILYAISGNANGYHMTRMVAAIIISFRMLSSGNLIQQNKAQGRTTDDPEDLCIYVDHCNGTSTFIFIKQENLCACREASCMGIFSVKKQHCGERKKSITIGL